MDYMDIVSAYWMYCRVPSSILLDTSQLRARTYSTSFARDLSFALIIHPLCMRVVVQSALLLHISI